MSDICLICGDTYPENDLIVCPDCNEDGARACGACGQLYTDQHADEEGLHFLIYCDQYTSNTEPSQCNA